MNSERQPLLLNTTDILRRSGASAAETPSTTKKKQPRRELQRPPNYSFTTDADRLERWGAAPDYEATEEEKSNIVGAFTYSWMNEDLKFASKAEFPKGKNGMTLPVAKRDSAWTMGQRMQKEFETELRVRGLWDGYIGQEVRLKSDASSRGILCWIGCCQASTSPRTLKVGVDWIQVPGKYKRAQKIFEEKFAQEERQHMLHQQRLSFRRRKEGINYDSSVTGGAEENEPWKSSLKNPPLHNGTLNGEVLFSTLDNQTTASVELPSDLRFVHQLYDAQTRKPVKGGRGVPRSTSLFYALYRGWGWRLLIAGLPKLVSDICTLSGPVILEQFIHYLEKDKGDSTWGEGLIWAFSFLLVYSIQSFAINKYFHITIKIGAQLRAAAIGLIYDKCMHLSSKAQAIPEMSQGRIVNMVSGDVERLDDVCWCLHFVWSSPLQLIVAVGLLYRLVGWTVFAGISVMFLSMPTQALITRFQSKLRTELLKCTDNRIKATNELFGGIRIVKFMVWENKFIEQVNELRKKEMAAFKRTQICRVASTFVSSTSPSLVMAGVFLAYHLSGHTLTPRVIFPTIALLNILRFPFAMIPMLLTIFVNCNVSMKRIAKFLEGEDIDTVIQDPLFYSDESSSPSNGAECPHTQVSNGGTQAGVVTGVPAEIVTNGGSDTTWSNPHKTSDAESALVAKASKYAAAFSNANITVYIPSCVDYQPPAGAFARLKATVCGCCSKRKKKKEDEPSTKSKKDDSKDDKKNEKGDGKGSDKDKKKDAKKGKKGKTSNDEVHNLTAKTLLSNLSVRFPRGKLTIVAGPTGCGKTTMLSSLLGEQELSQGSIYCDPSVAYVPQQPWILNATFKANITFFEDLDEEWFTEVIQHCALGPDIEQMINGIDTEIGERGVTLSGGQKARVSLARAVYAKKSMYLLDDPLSAVDAHVSEKLVHSCFLETLAGTTRVLVTHHHQYIPLADHVVIMAEDGSIWFQGTPAEWNEKHGSDLATPLSGMGTRNSTGYATASMSNMGTPQHSNVAAPVAGGSDGENSSLSKAPAAGAKLTVLHNVSTEDTTAENTPRGDDDKGGTKPTGEGEDDTGAAEGEDEDEADDGEAAKDVVLDDAKKEDTKEKEGKKLMDDEEKATGHVKKEVYHIYLQACGGWPRLSWILVLYFFTEIVNLGSSIWLTLWSTQMFKLSQTTYLYGYIGLVAAGAMGLTVRTWWSFDTMRIGSLNLHKKLLKSVARAPMSFFDTTPLGRVLNRFAKDIDQIDNMLPYTWMSVMALLFTMVGNLGVMLATQPFILGPLIPLGYVYVQIFKFYNAANREMKRVSSITKSPIFALLSEALAGMRCIIAFHKTKEIMQEAVRRLDALFSISYMQHVSSRWLAIRLELMGNLIVFSIAFLAVVVKQTDFLNFGVGLLSLGVTLSLNLTSTLIWLVRTLAGVESGMNSVERIAHYSTKLDQEETWKYQVTESGAPPPPPGGYNNPYIDETTGLPLSISTPQPRPKVTKADASLVFRNVSLRYRPGLPLALNKLSFTIAPGEKVGIVGRTGSGKSTLMLALMRIVEVCEGSITLGGVSTRCFTLDDIRSRFAMIPQDPILFEGTVRSNLDPFKESSDEQLWDALRQVGMEHRIRHGPGDTANEGSKTATPQPQEADGKASASSFPSEKKTKDGEAATGLESVLSDGGKNFSVGQRQLLCLARAMLQRNAQFVLMDEATANIDPDLDAIIQRTIRTAFADRTVITIAHRLNTVLDADKIVLLEVGGFLGEVGSPYDLVHNAKKNKTAEKDAAERGQGGQLKAMIAANGKAQEKKLMAVINNAHKARVSKKKADQGASRDETD